MKKLLAVAAVLLAQTASAGVLQNQLGTRQIEGVTLSTSADLNGQKLAMVGAGLRKKKVLVMTVNVYVAQLFLSAPEKLVRQADQALASAAQSQVSAVQLTFLRDVEAEKVQTSFLDALQANNVNLQEPEIRDFLSAVNNGGDAKSGKTLTIAIKQDGAGKESLVYEDTSGSVKTVSGQSGFAKKVLSIWLGKPADSQLEATKTQILSNQ